MENNKSNNNQGSIVKAFLLMTAIIGFIGGFVLAGNLKDISYKAGVTKSNDESSDIYTAALKGNKTFGFDDKKVEADGDYDYTIDFGIYAGTTNIYFTYEFGDAKNELEVLRYNYDNDDVQEYTLTFASNVVDVFFGQFDYEPSNNTIFYLLENGDICYSLVEDMVKEDVYGTYTTIEDIKGAVKFYNSKVCDDDTSACSSTTLTQTKDGKIYDLGDYITKTTDYIK